MSLWHEHAMADARQADLRRDADIRHARHRRPVGASVRRTRAPGRSPGSPSVKGSASCWSRPACT